MICEACLTRPVFGLMTLHDDEHLVASWLTCCECADHDAPIHTARGMRVAVVGGDLSLLDLLDDLLADEA